MRANLGIRGGMCPNPQCQKKLYFPEHEASVECTGCGQRHTQSVLKNLERSRGVAELLGVMEHLLYQMKKDAVKKADVDQEAGRVHGLSNYMCTILSPLLTTHGMDRASGRAKLLTDMGKPPVFDCAQLGDRAFFIDPSHLSVPGYGRDRSGSSFYLHDTLSVIKSYNENEERLVPIHADGDGHCLVHAVSRALVGWELFWHPLRVNLKQHFVDNLSKYKMQFEEFITNDSEWQLIIQECDPDFQPVEAEPTGLRNIHIFGLANVLKRPIILLDSMEGINSPGDYSAIFLPCFSPPSECMNKEGVLNKPLCIAWSSQGRNHFIPLVGVKGRKCPVLSRHMIQRSWGVSDIEIDRYVTFDGQGMCQVGGEKVLQIAYIQRLVTAMSDVFLEWHGVAPSLIADVYEHIFKANGLVFGMNLNFLLDKTKTYISGTHLRMCLACWRLALAQKIPEEWLLSGGELHTLAVKCHNTLKDGQCYQFPVHDVIAMYSAAKDRFFCERKTHGPLSCPHCGGLKFRDVDVDYSVKYVNGDPTRTKSSKTPSGYKHFYDGKEYETTPKTIQVHMEWNQRVVKKVVHWFQDEEDPSLNSNVYEIAAGLVEQNFPGEFGSERLVQKVVDQILRQTQRPETDGAPAGAAASVVGSPGTSHDMDDDPATWSPHRPSKAIITGGQRQSVHKEELNKSATERQIKQRIESNAPKQQRKLSDQTERRQSSPSTSGRVKTPERKVPLSTSLPQLKSPVPSSTTTAGTSAPTTPSQKMSDNIPSSPASVNKRIRLSTSDSRNITLDLPSECTFLELQSLICMSVGVEPAQQRIRHGFPPKELKPPASPAEDYKVPVQPGDKIMLDIVGLAQNQSKHLQGPGHISAIDKGKIHGLPARREDASWTSFAEGGMDEVSDRVLQGLMDPLLASGGDNLDHSLSALALTAALDNKDMWTYVQQRPHLFSVNGLFYKQAERDVGLDHGKHCQLPLLPHKLFVYNRFDDRLELCLEPYGHFPIEHNVEKNAGSMLPTSKCSRSGHKPFSGQGHMLRSSTSQEERMPTDVPMSPKRHEARRLNTMCDPTVHQESIEEEDEEEAAAAAAETKEEDQLVPMKTSHRKNPIQANRNLPLSWGSAGNHNLLSAPESARLVRKGPGYSELSPIPENSSNEKTEMLQQLVSRIEQACESMGQEAEAIGEGRELSPTPILVHSGQVTAASAYPGTTLPSAASATVSSSVSVSPGQQTSASNNSCDISSFRLSHSSTDSAPAPLDTSAASSNNIHTTTPHAHSTVTTCRNGILPEATQPSSQDEMCSQGAEPTEASSSMVAALAGQVASDIAAMDTDAPTPASAGNPSEQEAMDKVEDELETSEKMLAKTSMESESQSLKMDTESQSYSSVGMEMESTSDGRMNMEDGNLNETMETVGVLDDLFITEPAPNSEAVDSPGTPTVEKMDSP